MDKYNQKWVLWFAPQNANTNAITIGQTAYYSVSKEVVERDIQWQKHENRHKEQWGKEGVILFPIKYLYYLAIYGYWNNPYEIDARSA